ncbi:sensor histidine kinase [Microtetraspora niveoalba]|uniref:sensor histidine kinase n=1 Tax=Microtetraspora niveoalba TaxID=46175 RepID=UPI000829D912|nr:ATP-binding protein [Microtetraspora niveoalba]
MIDDVVRDWPGLWRHPDLAAALTRDEDRPDLAGLLLRGLADPLTVEESAGRLIAGGEFATAEELHQRARLAASAAKEIADRLDRARASAAVRIDHDVAALRRRAAGAGVPLEADVRGLTEAAWRRLGDAEAMLGELDATVRALEEEATRELRRSLAARAAGLDQRDRAVRAWMESSEACVQAREFETARALIGDGPLHRHADTEPRLVPRLREAWPYDEDDLETIMSWYFDPAAPCPPGFAVWRPAEDDAAAWALLGALRDAARDVNRDSAGALLGALHELLGTDHPWLELDDAGHGVMTRISLPDNPRLPCLSFLGRRGLATWVSNPRRPHGPPPCDDGPLLWISPSVRGHHVIADRASTRGVAMLDAAFLLRLAAPLDGRRVEPPVRLVNLLRAVCARLSPDQVMNWREAARHSRRHHLSWLLHLLGVSADGVTVDAVRYETGGSPAVLRGLLNEALPEPRHDRPRAMTLDLALLNELRERDAWRTAAAAELLAPHAGDRVAMALLWTAADFDDDEFTLGDLCQGLRSITEAEVAEVVAESELPGAAESLVRAGLFERAPGGRLRLPQNGIRRLLAERRPGHVPRDQAVLAARDVYEDYRDTAARRIAGVGDRIVRMIGHKMNGRRAVLRSALEDGRAEQALSVVDSLPSIHELYARATAPERPCRLTEILRNPLSVAQGDSEGMLRCELTGGDGMFVHANPWLLGECFFNLFDNARLAVRETGREFGTIRVTVAVRADAPDLCVIDVEDSGVGLSAEDQERLARGDRFSTHGGSGVGFRTARSWFRAFRGRLEIAGRSAALGGAHLRVTLPLTAPPSAPPSAASAAPPSGT